MALLRVNRNRIVLLKYADCIDEYAQLYGNEPGQISDGPEPYLKQVISSVEKRSGCCISVVGLGHRNRELVPRENIELKVIKDGSHWKVLTLVRLIKNSVRLFAYLARRRPSRIISLGGVRYVFPLLFFSYFSRSEMFLFLAEWIQGDIFLNRLTVKMMDKRIARVFSVNRANLEILQGLGYSRQCDLYRRRYAAPAESATRPTELRADTNFRVLFVGRLASVKGIEILKEVARRLQGRDVSFYVIGDGPCREGLSVFRHRHNLSNLHLLGFIPNHEVYSYIQDSDVGILPSRSEGLAKTILEFMLMKTPVVASNVGGIPEVVHDGVNGFLVEAGDVEGFCERIERLHHDAGLLLSLSRGTMETRAEILNWTHTFASCVEEIIQ